jgi:hypothetical protein
VQQAVKKTDMTNDEIKQLLEVAVDSAFCAVFDESQVNLTPEEANCKELAIRSLTLLAKGINDRLPTTKTIH